MENPIISVKNVSKRYNLSYRSDTLRESAIKLFKRKEKVQSFWALKDVSFDVKEKEIIGIIGRNGAGKSTLLKILSRITPPTNGKITLKGRTASLLEVGTGFHPELTGRENIYLNGSILGMQNREINQKFDEIVAFSGIERFLDTPVKRYSSGMYVRLAFSVAAQLEPEILLIDEVLAVGDAEFQKKCLGKMKNISQSGRTILFVSHNMATISNICERVILLENGHIKEVGDPETIIEQYLESFKGEECLPLAKRKNRKLEGDVMLTDIRILDAKSRTEVNPVIIGQDIIIEISYETINDKCKSLSNVNIALALMTEKNQFISRVESQEASNNFASLPLKGQVYCKIPRFPLMRGNYYINTRIAVNGVLSDAVEFAKTFEVMDGDFFGIGSITRSPLKHQGVFFPHSWEIAEF